MLRRPHGYDLTAVYLIEAPGERSRQRARIAGRYRDNPQVMPGLAADDDHSVAKLHVEKLSQKQQFALALFAHLASFLRHCSPQRRSSLEGTIKRARSQVESDGART